MGFMTTDATAETIFLLIVLAVAFLLFLYFSGIAIPGIERFFGLIK